MARRGRLEATGWALMSRPEWGEERRRREGGARQDTGAGRGPTRIGGACPRHDRRLGTTIGAPRTFGKVGETAATEGWKGGAEPVRAATLGVECNGEEGCSWSALRKKQATGDEQRQAPGRAPLFPAPPPSGCVGHSSLYGSSPRPTIGAREHRPFPRSRVIFHPLQVPGASRGAKRSHRDPGRRGHDSAGPR